VNPIAVLHYSFRTKTQAQGHTIQRFLRSNNALSAATLDELVLDHVMAGAQSGRTATTGSGRLTKAHIQTALTAISRGQVAEIRLGADSSVVRLDGDQFDQLSTAYVEGLAQLVAELVEFAAEAFRSADEVSAIVLTGRPAAHGRLRARLAMLGAVAELRGTVNLSQPNWPI